MTTRKVVNDDQFLYRASKRDCDVCPLKMQCCPKEPARKVPRSIYEEARDVARACAKTEAYVQSRRDRKKIENAVRPLEAHLASRSIAATGPERRSVRVHSCGDRTEPEATRQACGSPPTGHVDRVRRMSVAFGA